MSSLKNFVRKHFAGLLHWRNARLTLRSHYRRPKFAQMDATSHIGLPILVTRPERVFLSPHVRIQSGARLIIHTGRLIIGRYTGLSFGCTIITGNHTPTVGTPQNQLVRQHKNDRERDIVIGEDCWIGANVTLLSGAQISRGCVVGACAMVNKFTPPYAVVVGCPARIIGSKFTKEQIIRHEQKLYPENERLTEQQLDEIFEKYYQGMRSIGIEDVARA